MFESHTTITVIKVKITSGTGHEGFTPGEETQYDCTGS